MITKRSKRFMAVLFTTIMTIGSATSAFASDANPTDTTVTRLSNYNTPYTTVVSANSETDPEVTLKVTGLNDAYQRVPLSEEQAEDVTWSIKDGGTITPSSIDFWPENTSADGYVSVAKVTIPKGENYGYAIAEAKLGTLPAFDYVIAVNPTSAEKVAAVKNITVNFEVGNTTVASKSIAELGANTNTSATAVMYPTALSAVLALQNDPNSNITDVEISYGYLTSLKIGETPYPAANSNGYWTYTVTNSAGVTYTQSEIVGASAFQLHSGDVVTWTCVQ